MRGWTSNNCGQDCGTIVITVLITTFVMIVVVILEMANMHVSPMLMVTIRATVLMVGRCSWLARC